MIQCTFADLISCKVDKLRRHNHNFAATNHFALYEHMLADKYMVNPMLTLPIDRKILF